jgi:plastocyanin
MDRLDRARTRSATLPSPTRALRLSLPFVAAVALAAAFLLPTAPARSAETANTGAAVAATVQVSMGDDFFSPQNVTINVGDTVSWTNGGSDDHTATSTAFNSGSMAPGDTFQHTFNTAGNYVYVCSFHDDMTGTVTVNATTPPPPTVRIVSFGPNPYRLAGTGRLKAVYRVGQASTVAARIVSVATGKAVYSYARRTTSAAASLTYYWNGKNSAGRDVRTGRYKFVTTVTDRQSRRVVSRKEFRVVR